MDGSTTLGTGTLNAGVATFSISTLAVGSNSITGVYSGDPNFTTSNSSTLNQKVTQTAQAVTADLVAQLVDSALDALTSDDTSEDDDDANAHRHGSPGQIRRTTGER